MPQATLRKRSERATDAPPPCRAPGPQDGWIRRGQRFPRAPGYWRSLAHRSQTARVAALRQKFRPSPYGARPGNCRAVVLNGAAPRAVDPRRGKTLIRVLPHRHSKHFNGDHRFFSDTMTVSIREGEIPLESPSLNGAAPRASQPEARSWTIVHCLSATPAIGHFPVAVKP
jgi:hypothetical protein